MRRTVKKGTRIPAKRESLGAATERQDGFQKGSWDQTWRFREPFPGSQSRRKSGSILRRNWHQPPLPQTFSRASHKRSGGEGWGEGDENKRTHELCRPPHPGPLPQIVRGSVGQLHSERFWGRGGSAGRCLPHNSRMSLNCGARRGREPVFRDQVLGSESLGYGMLGTGMSQRRSLEHNFCCALCRQALRRVRQREARWWKRLKTIFRRRRKSRGRPSAVG